MSFILLGILNSQAAAGGAFPAPDFLTSAPLWLDAADASTITESGGSVSQWDNKGTGENFSQATSASQPTTGVNTLNGRNILDFDVDFLRGSDSSQWKFMHDGTTYFYAGVFKRVGTGDNAGYLGTMAALSSNVGFNMRSDPRFIYNIARGVGGESTVFVRQSSFTVSGEFSILSGLVDADASAADRIDYYRNNTQGTETNGASFAPSTSNPSHNLEIGAAGNAITPLIGSIAEIVVVSGADATETNRQTVVDYLNAKWGVF